jgi:drug/metabolite transporter (DMT)-like permease
LKPLHLTLMLLMNLFWAAVYSAYKMIGADLSAGGIVTLRFGIGGLCLLALWPWLPGRSPRGRDLWVTCLLGVVVYVVGQRLQVGGTQLGTAGNSAVLMGVEPLVVSTGAALWLREHIGGRRWAGFVLGLFGVAVLNGVWRSDFHWTGLTASLMMLGSFVCEGAYSVFGKGVVERSSPYKMLVISLLIGLAANLLIDGSQTLETARSLSPRGWWLVLAMAIICTAVGYSLWFVLIRECPVNVLAMTVFTQSVFGVMLAALWLGEPLKWEQVLGCLVIVVGLVLGLTGQRAGGVEREGARA